jgi:hypothetical protein
MRDPERPKTKPMPPSAHMLVVRLAALTLVALSAATSAAFASSASTSPGGSGAAAPRGKERAVRGPSVLVVPDVERQPYVFAKGILEDAGFSWRTVGSVQGFAGNLVSSQTPRAGTRVLDTGAPAVALRLTRNPEYAERGVPANKGSRPATRLVVLDAD